MNIFHNRIFKFKQFELDDSRCSMKLTSDSVILGAWADFSSANTVLDIGTGCGILSLMAAQRSNARIEAIEIEPQSAAQVSENVAQSKWADRIHVVNEDIKAFYNNKKMLFDVIICNPPYFVNSKPAITREKTIAKHDIDLKYDDLARIAAQILDDKGSFYLIIPVINYNYLLEAVTFNNMFVNQQLWILPRIGMSENRVCLKIQKFKQPIDKEYLILRNSNNSYTAEYINLTKDFYLKLS